MDNNISKKIRLLIIDCDGTLVDTKLDILNALNSALSELSLKTFTLEELSPYVGSGIRPLIEKSATGPQLELLHLRFAELYLENVAVHSRLFDGWHDFLTKTTSIKKYLLSNKLQVFLDPLVKNLAIDHYFIKSFGREAFSERKPSPVPILEIMKLENIPKEETMIIGDSYADILAGQAAGINVCAALFGYETAADLMSLKPDFHINSVHDLFLDPILSSILQTRL